VEQIIEFLLSLEVDQSAYLSDEFVFEDIRLDIRLTGDTPANFLAKGAIYNLLLAADCLSEIRKPDLNKAVFRNLLERLKAEAQKTENQVLDQEAAILLLDRLVIIWQNSPWIWCWLESLLQSSINSNLPQSAIEVIAKYWSSDPKIFSFLKDRALLDKNSNVRFISVRMIIEFWREEPDVFSLLFSIATQDDFQDPYGDFLIFLDGQVRDGQVRDGFSQELHKDDEFLWDGADPAYTYTVRTFSLLPINNPRLLALKELLAIAPENPKVIDLLRDRAANDPDNLLRKWATEQLAKIDPQ